MKIKIFKILIFQIFLFLAGTLFAQENSFLNKDFFKLKLSSRTSLIDFELTPVDKLYTLRSDKLITEPPTQNKKGKKYKIHPVRFSILAGGIAAGWLGMHIYYSNTWWKDRAHYFKFDTDTYYARNVDKLSHVYTANLISVASAQLYEWTGMNPTLAMVVGSSTAIAYETYIEVYDGISPNWGFDWGDVAANFMGALLPIAQNYVKPLQAFNIKWSFEPDWLSKKLRKYPDLLDDYTSMKFWLTFNPYYILPKSVTSGKWYPSFLGIGLGINLQSASHTSGATKAFKEYYLAFDIDINRLPGNTDFLKKFKKVMNFYHLPMPGVKIYKNTVWYGLMF